MIKKHRIAYLVHGERPLNGILETQVFKLYNAFAESALNIDVTIFLFAHPFIYFKLRNDYRTLKLGLKKSRIELKIIPFIIIPERLESKSLFFTKLSFITNIICYLVVAVGGFGKIICRSYVAAFNMCRVKAILGIKPQIIFDPRSVFPLERKSFNFFKTDRHFNFWLNRELFICKNSTWILYISEGMREYFESLSIDFKTKLFYLPISYAPSINSLIINGNLQGKRNRINLLYVGSLNIGMHNNDANHYVKRCADLIDQNNLVHFVFVLPKVSKEIRDLFSNDSRFESKVSFFEGKKEVEIWLRKADFGIYFLKDSLESFTRYGVKSVEYLCNGLPIIYDSGAEGIGKILKKFKYGIDISDYDAIKNLDNIFFNKTEISMWAKNEHSLRYNVVRLENILLD